MEGLMDGFDGVEDRSEVTFDVRAIGVELDVETRCFEQRMGPLDRKSVV